ncbi:hypothetical protein HPB47_017738 [Ixodes persulcatus]|uniref:Uncharacterized protein n=1 Tax=Ixodes persulcatus TaxID=34615 RepID=A0AC60QMI0_IXOPE|nr:hypothetical protein HPB47_017738 [Ixodes persulcatus]
MVTRLRRLTFCPDKSKRPIPDRPGATVPTAVMNILEKGPKFATEPSVRPSELLALVLQISAKMSEDNRDRAEPEYCGLVQIYRPQSSFNNVRKSPFHRIQIISYGCCVEESIEELQGLLAIHDDG